MQHRGAVNGIGYLRVEWGIEYLPVLIIHTQGMSSLECIAEIIKAWQTKHILEDVFHDGFKKRNGKNHEEIKSRNLHASVLPEPIWKIYYLVSIPHADFRPPYQLRSMSSSCQNKLTTIMNCLEWFYTHINELLMIRFEKSQSKRSPFSETLTSSLELYKWKSSDERWKIVIFAWMYYYTTIPQSMVLNQFPCPGQ